VEAFRLKGQWLNLDAGRRPDTTGVSNGLPYDLGRRSDQNAVSGASVRGRTRCQPAIASRHGDRSTDVRGFSTVKITATASGGWRASAPPRAHWPRPFPPESPPAPLWPVRYPSTGTVCLPSAALPGPPWRRESLPPAPPGHRGIPWPSPPAGSPFPSPRSPRSPVSPVRRADFPGRPRSASRMPAAPFRTCQPWRAFAPLRKEAWRRWRLRLQRQRVFGYALTRVCRVVRAPAKFPSSVCRIPAS